MFNFKKKPIVQIYESAVLKLVQEEHKNCEPVISYVLFWYLFKP